jgi:hypothetical protein
VKQPKNFDFCTDAVHEAVSTHQEFSPWKTELGYDPSTIGEISK